MPTTLVPAPPNLCWCGHDLVNHNSTTCLLCNQGAGNNHFFSSEMEMAVKSGIASDRVVGYVVTGNGTVSVAGAINHVGGYPPGTTVLQISGSVAIVHPGDSVVFESGGINQETCILVSLVGSALTIQSPGLLNAHAQGTPLMIQGASGSEAGPSNPANGQRAG